MNDSVSNALKNISWLISEKVFSLLAGLLVFLVLARSLGPEQFGILSYMLAIMGMVAPLASLGLHSLVTRELITYPEKKHQIISTTICLRMMGAFTGALVCFLSIFFNWVASDQEKYVFLIMAMASLFNAFNVLEYWFQAQATIKIVARMRFRVVILFSVVKVVAALIAADFLIVASIFALESILLGLWFLLIYWLNAGPILLRKANFSYGIRLLKQSFWLIFSGVASVIYLKIDQVMLRHLVSEGEVGVYAVAAKLSEVWYFIAEAIMISLFPVLLALKNSRVYESYHSKLQNIMDALFLMALVVALAMFQIAEPLIILCFGNEYVNAIPILQLHVWGGLFIFMRAAVSRWLITESLMYLSLVSHGVGAVVNVVANFLLIPKYSGMGAALATVISYFVASYFIFWVHPRSQFIASLMTRSILLPATLGYRYWPRVFSRKFD